MDKYKNKYRIPSARAQWWDYGWNGAYFITICTQRRKHFFGDIQNGKMNLSGTGVIADILWHEIPNHSSFVELGDFVVMPNHIHGILILNKPNGPNDGSNVISDVLPDGISDVIPGALPDVETGHALSLQLQIQLQLQQQQQPLEPLEQNGTQPTIGQSRFQNIGENTVSSIIGSYKSAVTKHANRLGLDNGWQTRFHDHIIRNDAEYQRISDYIINNPAQWEADRFFKS